jgi:hypothetical protein
MPLHDTITFTGADGTTLNGYTDNVGAGWSGAAFYQIQGNQLAVSPSTNGSELISNRTWADGDFVVEFDVVLPASAPGGSAQEILVAKVCNGVIGNSVPRIGVNVFGDLRAELRAWGAPTVGPYTVSLNGNVAYAPGTVLRLRCEMLPTTGGKQDLKVYVNGTLATTFVDWQSAAIAGPYALGFRVPSTNGGGTFLRIDNLVAHDTELAVNGSLASRSTTQLAFTAEARYGLPPINYQWYASDDFIAAGGIGVGTAIAGGNVANPTLTPTDSKLRWYYCRATDANGYDAFSAVRPARRLDRSFAIGAVGSSTFTVDATGSGNVPTRVAARLERLVSEATVTIDNRSVSGSVAGDWWLNTAHRDAVVNAFAAAQVKVCLFGWGVNDANSGRSVNDYVADVARVVNDLWAIGCKTVLLGIQCTNGVGNGQSLAYQYHAARASLIDNVKCFAADRDVLRYDLTAQDPTLMSDGIHSGAALQNMEVDWLTNAAARALGILTGRGGRVGSHRLGL